TPDRCLCLPCICDRCAQGRSLRDLRPCDAGALRRVLQELPQLKAAVALCAAAAFPFHTACWSTRPSSGTKKGCILFKLLTIILNILFYFCTETLNKTLPMKRFQRSIVLLAVALASSTAHLAHAQTARVQVIHNCADAAATEVDVWLDNAL